MKRASFAQRLVFILFFAALTSIAIGAPPPQAEGEPPPFNEENCTFEGGRTTCTVNMDAESFLMVLNWPSGGKCDGGAGTLTDLYHLISVRSVTARVVYYGTSRVVESQQVLNASAGTLVRWDYQYTYCRI